MLLRRKVTRFLRRCLCLVTPSWCTKVFRTMAGLKPGTFNVLQLAIGFLFIFFAFNSQGFIEQTVVSSKNYDLYQHAGYVR